MLDPSLMAQIQHQTQHFWEQEIRKAYFLTTAQGKEIGHRIADLVDDKTTGLLAVNYLTKYQRDRRGQKLPRSMGDIWLEHQGIYHPINVKASVSTTGGQPNMVSLKKLLNALLLEQIDSYYLLIVKFDLHQLASCQVYFLDMLDYLDYVTFDSGPGQIMLKANKFYQALAEKVVPAPLSLGQKVNQLLDLLEDGERRLIDNRRRVLLTYRQKVADYNQTPTHLVTAATQAALNLR